MVAGLKGVEKVVSYGHKGIQSSSSVQVFGHNLADVPDHFSRAVLNNIPNNDKEEVTEKLRQGFEDESRMAELAA